MTRAWLNSPYLLGFERLQELAERAAAGAETYPPYNVEAFEDGRLRVILAVAGFAPDELQIEIEDRQLTVAGEKASETSERSYLYRGIATRRFRRTFLLADGYEVAGARLENGLLHIEVARPDRTREVRRIAINSAGA